MQRVLCSPKCRLWGGPSRKPVNKRSGVEIGTRKMQTFSGGNAFEEFRTEISRQRRYLRSAEGDHFLRVVAQTCKRRLRTIADGEIFWRAQIGHEWVLDTKFGTRTRGPHRQSRMMYGDSSLSP